MVDRAPVHSISQRQLRNDSGEILRRAAAGEEFRLRAGEATVALQRTRPTVTERLIGTGQLTAATDDDFADFAPPPAVPGEESLDAALDAIRGER